MSALEILDKAVDNIRKNQGNTKDRDVVLKCFSDSFSDAIFKIIDYIEEYKEIEDLEVEFRLGYLEDGEFDTDVTQDFYDKIHDVLNDYTKWKKKDTQTTEDLFSNGKRKTIDLITKKETIVKKERLCILDFDIEGTPFDLRVSFTREVPKSKFSMKKVSFKRNKKRKTFVHEYWNYDLTTVTSEENGNTQSSFEVEIELNKPLIKILKKMRDYELVHSSLLKIQDLVLICENEEVPKFVFTREKKYD